MNKLMKTKLWFPILLLVLISSCTSEPPSIFDEADESFLLETQEEVLHRSIKAVPPPSICDDWLGGVGNGPPSGCVGNCPIDAYNFYVTISNLVCPTNDCYFSLRRINTNLFEEPYYHWSCAYGSGAGLCIDEEGTYVYNNLRFNYGPLPAGVPLAIRYAINGSLGQWPNAQGNSVTISWGNDLNNMESIDLQAFGGGYYPSDIYPVMVACP